MALTRLSGKECPTEPAIGDTDLAALWLSCVLAFMTSRKCETCRRSTIEHSSTPSMRNDKIGGWIGTASPKCFGSSRRTSILSSRSFAVPGLPWPSRGAERAQGVRPATDVVARPSLNRFVVGCTQWPVTVPACWPDRGELCLTGWSHSVAVRKPRREGQGGISSEVPANHNRKTQNGGVLH